MIGNAGTRPRDRLVFCAGFLVLSLALFPGPILRGAAFYERDIPYDWYPQVEALIRSVASGSWPVWDPGVGFGQPLLADPSAQIAYPFAWLRLFLLPWTYYTVFVVSHLLWSGAGLFLLARRLGTSSAGALCAAGIWTASGPLLSMVNLWHHFTGATWMPWVLLAAVCFWAAPGLRTTLLLGITLALQALGGSADLCLLTSLGVLALTGLRRPPGSGTLARAALLLLAALALAGALAAVQWLPTAARVLTTARADLGARVRTAWSATPFDLIQLVFPAFLADLPLRREVEKSLFPYGEPFLKSVYLSASAIALVALGLARGPRPTRTRLVLLGILGLGLALGASGPVYPILAALLPPIRMLRYPIKALVVPTLCWALLAGLGFDAWHGSPDRPPRRLPFLVAAVTGVAGAACVAGSWLVLHAENARSFLVSPEASAPALSAVALQLGVSGSLAIGAAVLAALAGTGLGGSKAAAVVAVASFLDLVAAHRSLNPSIPHPLLAFRPPVLEDLMVSDHSRLYVYDYSRELGASRKHLGRDDPYLLVRRPELPLRLQQVLSQRLYPFPSSAARWGVEGSYDLDVRGLYARGLDRLSRLLTAAEGTPAQLRLFRLGAVSRVVALHTRGLEDLTLLATRPSLFPEPLRVFAVPAPLPRFYVVGTARIASDEEALRLLVSESFDPRREIVVSDGVAAEAPPGFAGGCRPVDVQPDRVRLDCELSAPGFVVMVDSYDPGWRAKVDERPEALLRANVAFRAIPSPAGRHRIEVFYRPLPVLVGLGISASALGLLMILFVRTQQRSRIGP